MSLMLGVSYTALITVIAQVVFPEESNASLLRQGERVVGSELIAQNFESPRYFRSRPSAGAWATVASGASNKGPTSRDLVQAVKERRESWGGRGDIPADLLTSSASGLDPHLSPEAVFYQVPAVAAARALSNEDRAHLEKLIQSSVESGFLGMPRINVLKLNLALDRLASSPGSR